MINLKNILVELEFKTPEDFAAYKKKHKMRPGTVVKVAGKDKVVDAPKGKKTKASGIEFSTFGKKDIKRFADRYGVEVSNIRSGQQGNLADFEGDPEKIKKMLTSTQYGMEPEDANDLLGIKDKPKVDKKTDKEMSSAADKANMKMDRDEIMGLLNAKDEPFAEEVYDILDDKFKKMGSLGKELKQKIDTLASYEMGIYDMSEKEYEQGREELKKKLGDYYKEQGLDEGIEELSKITTRYTNRLDEMKVNKNDYSVDFTPEINDIQKSLNDTISKFKDLGKKLDTKATSVFPNYPKDAIHRRKPDTIDGQVFANTIKEFKVEPMIDWLEGNNKYWSALKFSLSKAEKAYPTTNRGKPLELDK